MIKRPLTKLEQHYCVKHYCKNLAIKWKKETAKKREREREQCFIWKLRKTMFYMGIRKRRAS